MTGAIVNKFWEVFGVNQAEEDEEYIMPETETDENIVNENNEKLKQGVLI